MDIGNDGVRITLPIVETHWRWHAFQGWQETRNLLVLITVGKELIAVPKHAVSDPVKLDQLRFLVQSNITKQTRGFPVLPVRPF